MGVIEYDLDKTRLLESLFDWPMPPFFRVPGANAHPGTEECEILFRDGGTQSGRLSGFNPSDGGCVFQRSHTDAVVRIDFESVKMFRLLRSLDLIPDAEITSLLEMSPVAPGTGQTFALEFADGKVFSGETVGHERNVFGLFLFLIVEEGRVQRIFVPDSAMVDIHLGELIGELLVKQQAATPEDVQVALDEQSNLRAQRLGDLLVEQKVVTRDELESALKHQESMPVMRLGEAIVSLGLADEAQITAALARQKGQRNVPLGQILIDMGVVSEQQMKEVLAKKLGIPFVSLDKYPVDLNAVRLLTPAFAFKHMVLPLYRTDSDIIIALEKPLEYEVLNQIRFLTSLRPVPVMATQEDLEKRIGESYTRSQEAHLPLEAAAERDGDFAFSFAAKESVHAAPAAPRATSNASELASQLFAEDAALTVAPTQEDDVKDGDNVLVQVVNKMIVDAFEGGASDIHVETYPGKQNSRIRFRKDGVMRDYLQIPANFRAALISRIKIMASLDISERRKPQDGKIEFALSAGRKLELRLATIPTANGLEDAVLRLLAGSTALPLNQLDMNTAVRGQLEAMADKSFGLILVCGPTGSGKTTTLHSLLAYMNTSERKIWTAEDPIEITQPGLRQVQMQHKIGWNFAAALRAFMRADPDVIMVGEMRDTETAKVGVEASLTGHVVLSTLHTNSAAESVTRLLDLGLEPFSFADALLGVLAQLLVRKLCPDCKAGEVAGEAQLAELALEYCAGTDAQPDEVAAGWRHNGPVTLYHPAGCKACEKTGYKGRTGLYELLVNGPQIRHLVQTRAPVSDILRTATSGGMRSLKQDGIDKVLRGITDVKQVRAVCN